MAYGSFKSIISVDVTMLSFCISALSQWHCLTMSTQHACEMKLNGELININNVKFKMIFNYDLLNDVTPVACVRK